MVIYCFIEGCKSSKYKKANEENKILTFFRFPRYPNLREKWVKALLNSGHSQEHVDRLSNYHRICSLHFTKNCIVSITGLPYERLKPNSVPTIFPNAPEQSTADIENIESSNIVSTENVDQHEEEINKIPIKKRILYTICCTDDIKSKEMEKMSPKILIKSLQALKKLRDEKHKVIRRLRLQKYRQRKRIERLQALLRQISPRASVIKKNETLQVLLRQKSRVSVIRRSLRIAGKFSESRVNPG